MARRARYRYPDPRVGDRFGSWTVVGPVEYQHRRSSPDRYVPVECTCGRQSKCRLDALMRRESSRCSGCARRANVAKASPRKDHEPGTPEYLRQQKRIAQRKRASDPQRVDRAAERIQRLTSRDPGDEEWAPIESFPMYAVSTWGRIYSFYRGGRCLRPGRNSRGYLTVKLYPIGGGRNAGRSHLIHVLVLEAFVGPRPSEEHDVCHANGLRVDNRLVNLRWDTKVANAEDRVLHRFWEYPDVGAERAAQAIIKARKKILAESEDAAAPSESNAEANSPREVGSTTDDADLAPTGTETQT